MAEETRDNKIVAALKTINDAKEKLQQLSKGRPNLQETRKAQAELVKGNVKLVTSVFDRDKSGKITENDVNHIINDIKMVREAAGKDGKLTPEEKKTIPKGPRGGLGTRPEAIQLVDNILKAEGINVEKNEASAKIIAFLKKNNMQVIDPKDKKIIAKEKRAEAINKEHQEFNNAVDDYSKDPEKNSDTGKLRLEALEKERAEMLTAIFDRDASKKITRNEVMKTIEEVKMVAEKLTPKGINPKDITSLEEKIETPARPLATTIRVMKNAGKVDLVKETPEKIMESLKALGVEIDNKKDLKAPAPTPKGSTGTPKIDR